jgi:hypothetical protein
MLTEIFSPFYFQKYPAMVSDPLNNTSIYGIPEEIHTPAHHVGSQKFWSMNSTRRPVLAACSS